MSFWDGFGLGGLLGRQSDTSALGAIGQQTSGLFQQQGGLTPSQMAQRISGLNGTTMYKQDPSRVAFVPMPPLAVIHVESGKRLIVWEP